MMEKAPTRTCLTWYEKYHQTRDKDKATRQNINTEMGPIHNFIERSATIQCQKEGGYNKKLTSRTPSKTMRMGEKKTLGKFVRVQ